MPYRRGEKDGVNEYQMSSQMLQNMFRSKMKFSEETILAIYQIFKSDLFYLGHKSVKNWSFWKIQSGIDI